MVTIVHLDFIFNEINHLFIYTIIEDLALHDLQTLNFQFQTKQRAEGAANLDDSSF